MPGQRTCCIAFWGEEFKHISLFLLEVSSYADFNVVITLVFLSTQNGVNTWESLFKYNENIFSSVFSVLKIKSYKSRIIVVPWEVRSSGFLSHKLFRNSKQWLIFYSLIKYFLRAYCIERFWVIFENFMLKALYNENFYNVIIPDLSILCT